MDESTIEILGTLHPVAQTIGIIGVILIPTVGILAFFTDFFENISKPRNQCKCGKKDSCN